MTASVPVRKREHEVARNSRLVPVIYKKVRVKERVVNGESVLNYHSYKVHGGVLDSNSVHGRGYYVRRLTGQDISRVMKQLSDIAQRKEEYVATTQAC